MRCLPGLISLLALGLAAPALAQDPVYTWVDAEGIRHYAQTPPDNIRYETLGVRDRRVGSEAATGETAAANPDQAACDRSRLALEQLKSGAPLQMDKDGDGKPEPLSEADRATQTRLAEQAVRAYCDAPQAAPGA